MAVWTREFLDDFELLLCLTLYQSRSLTGANRSILVITWSHASAQRQRVISLMDSKRYSLNILAHLEFLLFLLYGFQAQVISLKNIGYEIHATISASIFLFYYGIQIEN